MQRALGEIPSQDSSPVRNPLFQVTYDGQRQVQLTLDRHALPDMLVRAGGLVDAGRVAEALDLLTPERVEEMRRHAQEDASKAGLLYFVLGYVYQRAECLQQAVECYHNALESGDHGVIWNELAQIYYLVGRYSESLRCRERASRSGQVSWIRNQVIIDRIGLGQVCEGVAALRDIVDRGQADADLHSQLMWYLNYLPEADRQTLLRENIRWARMHAPVSQARSDHARELDPERRLRVGYVSADYRDHAVAHNFEPILDGRHPEAVEVYGYGNVTRPDAVTERLRSKFKCYRDIRGLDDAAVAEQIEQDRIDILVAVGGHTAGHRLQVLARKPAPIQVDMGSISTLGMGQVDYRLTDAILDPPGVEPYYVEHLVYLPDGYVCYRPALDAPAVGPLPAMSQGFVTFAGFGSHLKMNDATLALWAQVLGRVSGSHLLVKCPAGRDPEWIEQFLAKMAGWGVESTRIQITGWQGTLEHWQIYHQVDIGLDTYPYGGCLTTLEGLWMGVPTVSMAGDRYTSRVGLTLLSRVGLGGLVSADPDGFIQRAVSLAGNLDVLARIRGALRRRMMASPLCDTERYAHELESAYRGMWKRWCDHQRSGVGIEEVEGAAGNRQLTIPR